MNLEREKHYGAAGEVFYVVRGKMVEADAADNTHVPIPEGADAAGPGDYPPCPDCGGHILWAENGGVPGTRECNGCGSKFADMRWHA